MRWHEKFLSAEWRDLLIASYTASPEIVEPYLPDGVELDLWKGKALVSLVAFRFEKARILGVPAPILGTFAQVNLRFYVRRRSDNGALPGVVFIKELCPFALVCETARLLYHENYCAHSTSFSAEAGAVRYGFGENEIGACLESERHLPYRGSIEQFILERYHGYCKKRGGGTLEFWIEHPRWVCAAAKSCRLALDAVALYGESLGSIFAADPCSVFVASGSPVSVSLPRTLRTYGLSGLTRFDILQASR